MQSTSRETNVTCAGTARQSATNLTRTLAREGHARRPSSRGPLDLVNQPAKGDPSLPWAS